MARLRDQLAHAWNAFINKDAEFYQKRADFSDRSSSKSDRSFQGTNNKQGILTTVITRIAIDASQVKLAHVRNDADGNFIDNIASGLNDCLTVSANLDQAATAFRQDMVYSLCDLGAIGIIPVDTTIDPVESGSFDVKSLRVGKITDWFPDKVTLLAYNEKKGRRENVTLPKTVVAIAENPLYAVMNGPNSTLQRLVRKLNLLDVIDEQSGSGKLDLIIQLPYVIKNDTRKEQAEERRKNLELQLTNSKYGVAFTEATEKITQLNRPVENNLLKQVEYLTAMLYGQLGVTEEVIKGTADEQTMINYYHRTILPILTALAESMHRTFLTKTARSQMQAIGIFNDPFKFATVERIAEIADKFTRNEVLSSNEVRGMIGRRPSDDPRAGQLVNKNIPQPEEDPSINKNGNSQNGI